MNTEPYDVAASLESELDALWRFGLRLTSNQDDASELVQKTCVRALEQQQKYTNEGKFRNWLFQIQHRIWLNEIRSRKIRAYEYLDTTQSTIESDAGRVQALQSASPDASAETHIYLEQVYKALEQLPEAQRLAIVLVNVEGCSYKEAAEILDVPIGTVMSRLARARVTIGNMQIDNRSGAATKSTREALRSTV
jgi:RNA polymerase sigma-70 factor (ECF subfamily)